VTRACTHISRLVAAGGAQTSLAAKATTTNIPIVFQDGSIAVEIGLVASLSQPSANITGVTNSAVKTFAKQVPTARYVRHLPVGQL
jgi:putative ABC transport system substrate-binding protein